MVEPIKLFLQHSNDIKIDPSNDHAIDLQNIVEQLNQKREIWRNKYPIASGSTLSQFPSRDVVTRVTEHLKSALFPIRLGSFRGDPVNEDFFVGYRLNEALSELFEQIRIEQSYIAIVNDNHDLKTDEISKKIIRNVAIQLPELRAQIDEDVEAAFLGDPAAHYIDEILISYPGLIAIIHYRIAHALFAQGSIIIARLISEIAHSLTGIDIHPGASIGKQFFIDHGTGVVIGETAILGDRVRIYQAVTLGARNFQTNDDGSLKKDNPRHPILEDDVTVYAGATILGRITVGRGSIIGGNVWLLKSVPPESKIYQAHMRFGDDLQHGDGI